MKLIFLGDSTMQYNDATTYPQVGWPQTIYDCFKDEIKIFNFAKNGRSTKSFLNYNDFSNALKEIDDKSFVVIQFGHNDEHDYDPDRFTLPFGEYKDNLKYMISKCKEKGANILLLTPIYRRWFKDGILDENCHKEYRDAMIEVSKEENIDLIDMTLLTKEMLINLGDEKSKELFMNLNKGEYSNYPSGLNDNTHLTSKGGKIIGDIFINSLIKMNHSLSKYVKV